MQRRMTIIIGLAAVLVLGLAAAAWISADQTHRRDQAATEAMAAAGTAATAIFSYDYRSFDASVANGMRFVTGDFADEYAETTEALRPAAEHEQAVVRAEVSAAGIVEAATDRVEVLLYVNQYRRNVNISSEKVDQNRVVLTLIPVDGQWRVSHALAI
jgi:Mce-associated membrane protein